MDWDLVVRGAVCAVAVTVSAAAFGYVASVWIKARRDPGPPEYDPYDDW